MSWRLLALALGGVAALAIAALVYAQLGDTQEAGGSVNATSTSADLYICQPDATPGPACGSDDNGADELVFETLEDIRPGEVVEWGLRLKNVGSDDWTVTGVTLTVTETADPNNDCPDDALRAGSDPTMGTPSPEGVFAVSTNNNIAGTGAPEFALLESTDPARNIRVLAGGYEDVRLMLVLYPVGTDSCDGNEWDVSWEFTVS